MTSLEELAVEFVCHPLLLAIVRYSKKFGGPGISWQLLDTARNSADLGSRDESHTHSLM